MKLHIILASIISLLIGCRHLFLQSNTPNQSSLTEIKLNIPPYNSLPFEHYARIAAYKKLAHHIVSIVPDMAEARSCLDYSAKWLDLLNKQHGYRLSLAQTQSFTEMELQGTKEKIKRDKTHFFITDRINCQDKAGECKEEIIIDPTYLQFFDGGECHFNKNLPSCQKNPYSITVSKLATLPKIFVGNHTELRKIFSTHQAAIRLSQDSSADDMMGRYLSDRAVDLIYSLSSLSNFRTNITD